MTQRTIEEKAKDLIAEQAKEHFGLDLSKTEVYMKSEDFVKFMTAVAQNERRQADERLREVVLQIYAGVHSPIYKSRIQIIAKEHNIDITPNTPQV